MSERAWFWAFVVGACLFAGYGFWFLMHGRWILGLLELSASAGWIFNAYWRSRLFHSRRRTGL